MAHTHNERAPSMHFEQTGQHHASHNLHEKRYIISRGKWTGYTNASIARHR